MQRLAILIGFLLAFNSTQEPSVTLSQAQMVDIIVDLELTKAMIRHYAADEATADQLLQKNLLLVYEAHHTDEAAFQENFQYYFFQPKVLKEMYEAVNHRLEELQTWVE